ncbi:MAG TPA: histidine--tRNA ligase, partial [Nannocystis exedens]|nr:histidine--tRNA ligase [Nannocystis exedens]
RDFLPADIARRQYVIGVVRRVYAAYGFVPLETPTIENLSTLLGKYGDEGDQLLYRILHRRDNLHRALAEEPVTEADLADQGLRYDLTVPLARVVANTTYRLPKFFKRYQIQPVWRADRPGRGRFREFYQCDVDITGTTSLIAEAEVCSALAQVLVELGFKDFTIRLNHREVLRSMIRAAKIDDSLEASALVAVDKLDKIGREGVKKELAERGILEASAEALLRMVTAADPQDSGNDSTERSGNDGTDSPRQTKNPESQAGLELLAKALDESGQAALSEVQKLITLLKKTPAGPFVSFSPDLARGLSYYTGAIFEIAIADLHGSLGGGGRYDGLIGMFDAKGKKQVPSVGFSLGLERILVVMEERGMFPAEALNTGPDLLLCWLDVGLADVISVAHRLREQGLRVEIFPEQKTKLGKQLGYADSEGVKAPTAAILGKDELALGEITLKNLTSGEQSRVPLAEAAATIAVWRSSTTA